MFSSPVREKLIRICDSYDKKKTRSRSDTEALINSAGSSRYIRISVHISRTIMLFIKYFLRTVMPHMLARQKKKQLCTRIKEHKYNVKLDLSRHTVVSGGISRTSVIVLIGKKQKSLILNPIIIKD